MSNRFVPTANYGVAIHHLRHLTRRWCVMDTLKDEIVFQSDDVRRVRDHAIDLNAAPTCSEASQPDGIVKRSWACTAMTAVVQMREGFTPWRTIAAFELEIEAEHYCFRKLMVERVDTFYRVMKVVD